MAFGFPPSFCMKVDLVGLPQSAREAVIETFQAFEWEFTEIDPYFFKGKATGMSGTVSVSLEPGSARIKCELSKVSILDGGLCEKIATQFSDRFSIKEVRNAKIEEWKRQFDPPQNASPVEVLLKPDESETGD